MREGMIAKLRPHGFSATLALLALAVILTVAGAVVGVSQALAGPVRCGDTITTDTTLESDLLDCPNNGIVIGANGITLDLNGHTIDGDGQLVDPCPEGEFCDAGVFTDGHDGVTVMNGFVQDFATGVAVGSARNIRLAGLSSSRNEFFGYVLFDVHKSVVRDSAGNNNLVPDGDGMGIFASQGLRIVGNRFSGNALGIHVDDSTNNLIKGNLISRTQDGPGILVEANRNHMRGNVCRRNGICILVARGNGNVITRNHVRGDVGGIAVENGRRNLVIHNRLIETRRTGIILGVFGFPIGGGNNVVRKNLVIGSGSDAFTVNEKDDHSVLRLNVARGAGDDGFGVQSSTAKLTDNRAIGNGDLGIQAIQGVIDGGGNVARLNGDPRQCVNISCS
jgi:parallel beta-helix repeat protein